MLSPRGQPCLQLTQQKKEITDQQPNQGKGDQNKTVNLMLTEVSSLVAVDAAINVLLYLMECSNFFMTYWLSLRNQ